MSGFQFLHVEGLARKPSKRAKCQTSVHEAADEAMRLEGNCPHVANPKPPRVVGLTPAEVVGIAEQRAEQAEDTIGRRVRSDAPIVLSGVASYPIPTAEVMATREARAELSAWLADVRDFIANEWGEADASIVLHLDEKHPHVHFFKAPSLEGFSINQLHAGRAAKADAKAEGKPAKDQNVAYQNAMRSLQNRYHQAVGVKHGQARLGPGRRRLSRAEWHHEQTQAEALARAKAAADLVTAAAEAAGVARGKEVAASIEADAEARAKALIARARRRASAIVAAARGRAVELGGVVAGFFAGMSGKAAKLEADAERKAKAELLTKIERAEGKAMAAEASADAASCKAVDAAERLEAERRRREAVEDAKAELARRAEKLAEEVERLRPPESSPEPASPAPTLAPTPHPPWAK